MKKVICLACFALAGCSFGGSGNNGKNPSPADSARVIDVGKQQTTKEAVEKGTQPAVETPKVDVPAVETPKLEPAQPNAADLTPKVDLPKTDAAQPATPVSHNP